jgi:Sec-independent protein translocase protein TatA
MEFLNIGVWELLFILLIAFIVLGPRKAIKTAGDVGRWIRDLVNSPIWRDIMSTSREIRDLPKKVMDDEEIRRTIADLDRSTQDFRKTVSDVEKETQQAYNDLGGERKTIHQKKTDVESADEPFASGDTNPDPDHHHD